MAGSEDNKSADAGISAPGRPADLTEADIEALARGGEAAEAVRGRLDADSDRSSGGTAPIEDRHSQKAAPRIAPPQGDAGGVPSTKTAGCDQRDLGGRRASTFYNDRGEVEAVIVAEGGSTIVAIPRGSVSRDNHMGDDEYKCLKACKEIDDLEKRLNCILACPVSKNYRVFIA